MIFAGAGALALCILLFPRLARWIDSKVDPALERAAAHETQYREMTNAYPMAGELLQDHPIRKRWEECRAALLEAGYIETREFPLRPLTAKGATKAFFTAFHARFPGVECSVRDAKSDAPALVVTARKSDLRLFGDIKLFASQYDPKN
jgi:hypothetical protein